ncbi:MAG: phosphate ABC transporter permease PstA [Gammaproteobacteria bacterium]|nr:MAG: phosphate ABC transporter permease PstA [Gammaproteobacteria bacterium]
MMHDWMKSGSPWIWMNAAAVSLSIIIVLGLLALIAVRGLGHFWPARVVEQNYNPPNAQALRVIGEIHDTEAVSAESLKDMGLALESDAKWLQRRLIKTGNRDILGSDFRWLLDIYTSESRYPKEVITIERREWGNFYGFLTTIKENGIVIAEGEAAWQETLKRLQRAQEIFKEIRYIEKDEIGDINYGIETLRLKQRRLELKKELTETRHQNIGRERAILQGEYRRLQKTLSTLYKDIGRDSITAIVMNGQIVTIPLSKVVRMYRSNTLNVFQRLGLYFSKMWEFVSDEPREANTEGGIFPAIFGTVMMVTIMSLMVTPFGVVAAIYLREYAKQGVITRTIRIAVNNLAGVPSIVYGVFGLGFFVYFLGGNIDQLFFPEALPAPTYGTPGILWSSLTLAILTVPVVIVATEEGLSRIPRAIREGSLALGATKAETLWRTVLPMTTPAIMTGMILAVARAAGEVAPLMLVGVVKLAPSLPLDDNFPFLHLDRKFMHLGFHIYDVGFQSPNVEAARPLVYATALLLVLVIVILNLAAIWLRNRLRERYRGLES